MSSRSTAQTRNGAVICGAQAAEPTIRFETGRVILAVKEKTNPSGALAACLCGEIVNFEILRPLAAEPDDDEPGDRQLAEIEPIAQPRFEQPLRFGFRIGMNGLDAFRLRGDRDGFGDQAVDIVARARLHLDGGVEQHLRAPAARAVGDQQRRARRQAGEKGHDRDHHDQGAAGDRVARYELRIALERRLRLGGEQRVDDRFIHDGDPSKIVSLPSPTTSLRAKPNWSMSWRSWVAMTTAVPSR